MSGDCENPTVLQRWGRPSSPNPKQRYVNIPEDGLPYGVDIMVRCRHCTKCRRFRERLWGSRVMIESMESSRCWFVTLTFRLTEHMRLRAETPARYKDGVPRYAVRAAQLFVKRLRMACGKSSLRHMWVCELHKSGLPHLHMLLFEQSLGVVTKRKIAAAWTHGFLTSKLVEETEDCAKYVVKYVSKAGPSGTIRASRHFGTFLNASCNKGIE